MVGDLGNIRLEQETIADSSFTAAIAENTVRIPAIVAYILSIE